MTALNVAKSGIPGLLIVKLAVKPNEDGWFKENWHRENMIAQGLPDFAPVQHNVTHVTSRGVTRGFLAEPWDRIVSLVRGRAMAAWVDLRSGLGFGRTFTLDLDPSIAVFVPRGVAMAHQTLDDHTTFTYLMDHHWTPEARDRASAVNVFDPALGITWPIPYERAIVSRQDTLNPPLVQATPLLPRRTLIVGSDTPLGAALLAEMPGARGVVATELDPATRTGDPVDLSAFDTLISAHGDVVRSVPTRPAQRWTEAGDRARLLARLAIRYGLRYVQVSTDCVFAREAAQHDEVAALDLTDAWGQSLAAAELAASVVPRHLVVRTGWVATTKEGLLLELTSRARSSRLEAMDNHERGRLTSAARLAAGIQHLLDAEPTSGTFNITGDGTPSTRLELARAALAVSGQDAARLDSTPPPVLSPVGAQLALDKIKSVGFRPGNSDLLLEELVRAAGHIGRAGAAPAPRDADATFRVLFVCTANICRSAYADIIASATRVPGVEFSSAGTHALVGQPLDPPLARIAEEAGYDPTHSARQLTRGLAEEADLILVMASEHRRFILDAWPALARRTYVIGQATRALTEAAPQTTMPHVLDTLWQQRAPREGDDVADPFGKGEAAARTSAELLDRLVCTIVEGLGKRALPDEARRG